MPELPEVHTITTDLNKHVKGAVIKSVSVSSEFTVIPATQLFSELLVGKKITSVKRVAKNIVFELDSGDFLVIHLAMTGQILFRKKGHVADRWTRIIFDLKKDGKDGQLRYTDMRMFGKVRIFGGSDINELYEKYGPDPITDDLDGKKLMEILHSKRTNVKNALLDQKLLAGIGNIYATDALWMAKIHPEAKTKDLTLPMAKDLLNSIKEILNESIKNRGSTLQDKMYVDIFGKFGKQQDFFRIYGKDKCPRCEIPTKFKKINGRGTYYCDNCQKLNSQASLL